MALIGVNGGLIGKQRSAAIGAASGLWTANEQVVLKRAGSWAVVTDSDAAAYIAAVEAADGQSLEDAVKTAINSFVVGCKADGIWTAIKASCILAGARTRAGALTPLKGSAPTELGTAGGWNYNRETGLRGNGTDNGLNTNRNVNADAQNSKHLAVYLGGGTTVAGTEMLMGCRGSITDNTHDVYISTGNGINLRSTTANPADLGTFAVTSPGNTALFAGHSRSGASSISYRCGASSSTGATASASFSADIHVFKRNDLNAGSSLFTTARLSFYSVGESLDLALLSARVTTLINAIAAAIP